MTEQEFRRYANTREFQDLSISNRFDKAWENHKMTASQTDKSRVVEIFVTNSKDEILADSSLQADIFAAFPQVKYVTLNWPEIIEQINSYIDFDLPPDKAIKLA